MTNKEIKICCFQEVTENNIELLNEVLNNNDFMMLDKFPMKTELNLQYNIIAVRKEDKLSVDLVCCLPHGKDKQYKNIEEQIIDYNMSDYRTTIFVSINYNDKKYLIGNIHTDYISTEGKIKGTVKSLNYMDYNNADYKILVGDMNMVSHMAEVYNILKQSNNYMTLSRNKNFHINDNSWHGYATMEQVNVDFAFIEKNKEDEYEYEIIKQDNLMNEGSDHRPIIITVN